jgi:hypothetical protein
MYALTPLLEPSSVELKTVRAIKTTQGRTTVNFTEYPTDRTPFQMQKYTKIQVSSNAEYSRQVLALIVCVIMHVRLPCLRRQAGMQTSQYYIKSGSTFTFVARDTGGKT